MKTFITAIAITSIFVFASCKKDNSNPLSEPTLKKSVLGKWNLVDTKVVYKSGNIPSMLACIRALYNFLPNDTCVFNADTIPYKIVSNTQLIFDGSDCIEGHIYNVEIKNDTMQWNQVPPFANHNIAEYSYYFKRQP